MRLPVASVFLVRYANGTREVLAAPAPVAPDDPTPRRCAAQALRNANSWASKAPSATTAPAGRTGAPLGSTLYLGPLLGLAPTRSHRRPMGPH
ncbi:MAG: hypothetical protein WKG07_09450 [Hymenobacter sp.]